MPAKEILLIPACGFFINLFTRVQGEAIWKDIGRYKKVFHLKPSTMKTSILLLMLAVTMVFSVAEDLTFSVTIQGTESKDLLKDGVKPSELTFLEISTSKGDVVVEEFEILLARGKSPILRNTVEGNQFDLKTFRGPAKPGDRIVIKVNQVSGPGDNTLTEENSVIQIPIR